MKLFVQIITLGLIILAVACSTDTSTVSSVTPPPTLPPSAELDRKAIEASVRAQEDYQRALDAQRAATVSAAQAQAYAQQATVAANLTRDADNRTQTKVVNQIAIAKETTAASQTSVAGAITISAITQVARESATAHTFSMSQTVTTQNNVNAEKTASASQTAIIVAAVKAKTDEDVKTYSEKQSWERDTEAFRSVGMVIGILILVVGGVAVLVFTIWKLGNSAQAKLGEMRDANDELVIVTPRLGGGFNIVRPGRMPGAAMEFIQGVNAPAQITSGATDADVTKRDQAISMVMAAQSGAGDVANALDEDIEQEPIEQIAAPNIQISKPLESKRLPEMSPSRLALPVGTNDNGNDVWIPLPLVTHALVAGSSGMGKTRFLHGWIQSLIRGGVASIVLVDGKEGVSFARYADKQNVRYIEDENAGAQFASLIEVMHERNKILRQFGMENIADYNKQSDKPYALDHIVMVIDEIATFKDYTDELVTISTKARSSGIHLICATQKPNKETIHPDIQFNSILRVAFSVPTANNSVAVLGCGGAEKLGGVRGRMILSFDGTMKQMQAFDIDVPRPPMKEIPPTEPPKLIESESGESPSTNTSVLPPDIVAMVRYAVQHCNGMFIVTKIAEGLGIRPSVVTSAARFLEENGLLSQVLKDEGGQNIGRKISEQLCTTSERC